MIRIDGRANDALRPVRITPGYIDYAEGSALIEMGSTRVLCAATVEDKVPDWMVGKGRGWITAEYAMLPRSTQTRSPRESVRGHLQGRTHEISRLVGRSLRAGFDLALLGERMVTVDCDVIQADGGTRTASVTGGYVALALALRKLVQGGLVPPEVFKPAVAAVSVGIVEGAPMLDLCYPEDSRADADINVVMAADGRFIEVQGTAEREPFSRQDMLVLLDLAGRGIAELVAHQMRVIG